MPFTFGMPIQINFGFSSEISLFQPLAQQHGVCHTENRFPRVSLKTRNRAA
jgi:hypothetical protein